MTEQTRRLLLIEHDPEIVRIIQHAFAAQITPAYLCTYVERLEQAMRHLEHHTADVALLNLHLSDAKGLSTFRRLHAAVPELPIIVLATSAARAHTRTLLHEGAADVLDLDTLDDGLLRHVVAAALARGQRTPVHATGTPERRREVEALLAAMRATVAHRDFESAMCEIFRVGKDTIGAAIGFVALVPTDPISEPPMYFDCGDALAQMIVPPRDFLNTGIAEQVTETRQVIFENDVAASRWGAMLPARHRMLTNFLLAPLLLAGNVIGFLAFGNKPGGFTADDARVAGEFGEIVSIALHNTRLLASLESSEERFRSVVESATDAIICIDSRNTVISWNHGARLLFGYEAHEVLGKPLAILPDPYRRCHEQMLAGMVETGVASHLGKTIEVIGQRDNGTRFPVELSLSAWNTGEGIFFTGIFRDISERRAAEREQQRINQALSVLSDCNQALIRGANETDLLQSVCDLIVVHGSYRLACISYMGNRSNDALQLKAIALDGNELEPRALRDLGRVLLRQPFIRAAIENGDTITSRCLEELTVDCSWRETVVSRNYCAAIAVPLISEQTTFGVLVIFADAEGFDTKEATLLSELAVDLSYGIHALRVRRRHQQAEKALEQSKAKYHSLFEQMEEGFALYAMIYDAQGQAVDYRILDVNPAYEAIMAVSSAQVIGRAASEIYGMSSALPFAVFAAVAANGQPEQFRTYIPELDKFLRVSVFSPRVGEFATFFADITAHRRAEAEVQEGILRLRRALEGTVSALAATTERRDPYTAGHQQRVAQLACTIAHEMDFSEDDIEQLRIAALLHDIGKIAVPIEILTKPGKITTPEFSIIKDHAQVGYEILREIDFPWPVALVVLQHHGRLDGTGYPDGLNDTAISMLARILCVADVVEAMSSHRPYRPALGVHAALEEIASRAGQAYDADVVAACLRVFHDRDFSFE